MTTLQYWNLTQNVIYYADCYNMKILKNISNEKTGAECTFLEDESGQVYLVFKGTDLKLNDVMCDLLFKKNPVYVLSKDLWCKVHAGFYLQYCSIIEEILTFIRVKFIAKKMIILGHSLGGALTQIFYLDRTFFVKNAIVFGSPNFTSKIKTEKNLKIKNYQNTNDIITYLPPKFLNYHTIGKIIKLGKFNFWKLFQVKKEHQGYNQFFGSYNGNEFIIGEPVKNNNQE